MNRLRAFAGSMTARIFLILVVGVALSATIALVIAGIARQGDYRRFELERAIYGADEAVILWRGLSLQTGSPVWLGKLDGVRLAGPMDKGSGPDPVFADRLRAELPDLDITVDRASPRLCYGAIHGPAAAQPGCWLVIVQQGTSTLRLVAGTPSRVRVPLLLFDPLYLGVLGLAAAVMAFFVARIAASPLSSLSKASAQLGDDLARRPLPLSGPTELREAVKAFNAMQVRLQLQLAERTHMLAAITHDLQTPVTRLRLRLEKVQDSDLRERLLGDLAAMRTLIQEGLELARAVESQEPQIRVDLQSLVESLVEDAADAGQAVTLSGTCQVDLLLRPESLRRCLSNLIDNALKHGGSAEVHVSKSNEGPVVVIRDHGPGLPDDALERVFEPFVRLETSRSRETGGAGLGLTIARTLAERNGATVTLSNHPQGGAEAVIRFDLRRGLVRNGNHPGHGAQN